MADGLSVMLASRRCGRTRPRPRQWLRSPVQESFDEIELHLQDLKPVGLQRSLQKCLKLLDGETAPLALHSVVRYNGSVKEDTRIKPTNVEQFVALGGHTMVATLTKAIFRPEDTSSTRDHGTVQLLTLCFEILHFPCSMAISASLDIRAIPGFLGVAERLIAHPSLHRHAFNVLEAVLYCTTTMIPMTQLPHLTQFLSTAPLNLFSDIAHVLNFFTFDPDETRDCAHSISRALAGLEAYTPPERQRAAETVLQNHKTLLQSPHTILDKVFQVLRAPLWLLRHRGVEGPPNDVERLWVSQLVDRVPEHMAQMIFKEVMLQLNTSELFFILSVLLSGPQRREAQEVLVNMGLVRLLSQLLGYFDWGVLPPSHSPDDALHGPGCNCSTERQTKAQFLRLLHSLFDCVYGPDITSPPFLPILRRALLTPSQIAEWRRLAVENGIAPTEADQVAPGPGSAKTGDTGLLVALVGVLIAEPLNSPFLASMASCVDCYLRIATSADRFYLAERGLLAHVLRALLDETDIGDTDPREVETNRQSLFDLLAELIRFCPPALVMLDTSLPQPRLDRLMQAVRSNLVASNVFVRVLLLTVNSTPQLTQFHARINDSATQALLIDGVILLIANTLCSDNVCCLNTCILFLYFAHCNGRLPALLSALSPAVLPSLLKLLRFWALYYRTRTKDKHALQNSTRISFVDLSRVVETLLGTSEDPNAVQHWLTQHSAAADSEKATSSGSPARPLDSAC